MKRKQKACFECRHSKEILLICVKSNLFIILPFCLFSIFFNSCSRKHKENSTVKITLFFARICNLCGNCVYYIDCEQIKMTFEHDVRNRAKHFWWSNSNIFIQLQCDQLSLSHSNNHCTDTQKLFLRQIFRGWQTKWNLSPWAFTMVAQKIVK